MHVNAIDGVDCVDPSSPLVRADGNGLGNGWANSPQIEAQIAAWYNATSLDEEKTIARRSIGWPLIMVSTHR
jgi:peptide/nickel transport system substrate-binding protein